MHSFKLAYFQYPVVYKNRESNLDYIEKKVIGKSFDLLVLPELFTSGYAFDNPEELLLFGEDLSDSYTVGRLQCLAKKVNAAFSGTIPELFEGKLYNTAILVDETGLIGIQRKIHITDYEKRIFSAGNEINLLEYKDVRLGFITCFDSWFAPLSSKLKEMGVQVLCNSSCFGGDVTPKILPIRALENQVYVVSCNRVGSELFDGENESYRGESQIIDPDGNKLVYSQQEEMLAIIEVDLDKVNHPYFGQLICSDFKSEHKKYSIHL